MASYEEVEPADDVKDTRIWTSTVHITDVLAQLAAEPADVANLLPNAWANHLRACH